MRWRTTLGIPAALASRLTRSLNFLLGALLLFQPALALGVSSKGDIRVTVNVPKEAELGKSVNLACTWRLYSNSSGLYSVKWYKDEYEFFSYMPDNEPGSRINTYPQNGVNIDVRSSNKTSVRLMQVTLNSSGQYKCEVSTGAPFYATNYGKGNLTVIVLPNQGPEITGLSSHYAVGENLTANCTSWPSVPKARLQWTINGETVPAEYILEHPPHKPIKHQGTPNSLGLRLDLTSRHIQGSGNSLTIRCFAYVGSRRFEAQKRVQVAHANNQRFRAGDPRNTSSSPLLNVLLLLLAGLLLLAT